MSLEELLKVLFTRNQMKNDKYVDEVCNECASSYGAKMPHSHIASFYEGICDACGLWDVLCSARDYRYPKINKIELTKENKQKILAELKRIKVKYQSQANAYAVDEINSQINAFLD